MAVNRYIEAFRFEKFSTGVNQDVMPKQYVKVTYAGSQLVLIKRKR